MKIAFWSNTRSRCGVTSNMACIAALTAIIGVGKSIMLENHYNKVKGVGNIILPEEQMNEFCDNYYSKYGVEYILKKIYSGANGEELIRQAVIPLLYSSSYYLSVGEILNREVFNYDFSLVHRQLFNSLEQFAEYVFIDTESNQNLSSTQILYDADLVVVNLSQNPEQLREFFENYSSINEKAVYLIGSYQREIKWTLSRIRCEYHIPKDKIEIIPYNMEFAQAMEDGRMLQFLNRNYVRTSGKENRYFISHAVNATLTIRDNAKKIKRKQLDTYNRQLLDRVCQGALYAGNI